MNVCAPKLLFCAERLLANFVLNRIGWETYRKYDKELNYLARSLLQNRAVCEKSHENSVKCSVTWDLFLAYFNICFAELLISVCAFIHIWVGSKRSALE